MNVPVDKVSELLKKQRRVESMVHNQSMPRQVIVETLVQRQHLAELQQLLSQRSASEIGTMLESLPLEDANVLWAQLPAARQNDVLWEISDSLRALLADNREPAFNESQITAFVLVEGRLRQIAIEKAGKAWKGCSPSGLTCWVPARLSATLWACTLALAFLILTM
jgi:magnesium transporter